jgi:hypothetical protein
MEIIKSVYLKFRFQFTPYKKIVNDFINLKSENENGIKSKNVWIWMDVYSMVNESIKQADEHQEYF